MTARDSAVRDLQTRIGHSFADASLLERSLTHASLLGHGRKVEHNQRLEFLGDRVLGLVIAEALMTRHPDWAEGDMSRRLNSLVSGDTCARIAAAAGVAEALRHVAGSARKPTAASRTLLGDACEAIIAAVYLDGGLEAARAVILNLWAEELAAAPSRSLDSPKNALKEWFEGDGKPNPLYEIIQRDGPAHAPMFTVRVTAEGLAPVTAKGPSRQSAEKAAALALLTREGRL